jgi:Kef-type K+ transport system membrane component KefB
MDTLAAATILAAFVLLASMASVELGISVAIIEIALGVFAGNVLGITSTPWIDFLAAFAGIVLTFLAGALPLLAAFFVVKIAAKFAGVYPPALRWLRPHATYTTLLMSTGLTFGTISSLYGLNAGIIDRTQFSVLITTVILSAIVPTFLAQRFFSPPTHKLSPSDFEAIEDEEFEPAR